MQVAALSLWAILFLLFGALDGTLTASKIESLPHCPHLTLSDSILHAPFLTLLSPCSPHLNPSAPAYQCRLKVVKERQRKRGTDR